MWNIAVFNHLQCISAQTHSVVYTDCLAHPETDTVHNFTFFPYKINPCSLLPVIIRTYLINYASKKASASKKPLLAKSSACSRLKCPLTTILALKCYQTANRLISIYLDYSTHAATKL